MSPTYSPLLLLAAALSLAAANPAIVERAFRRYVDSNECLRGCMQPVQASERDIAIFKNSNLGDYVLNLDSVCATIETARACINACGVRSNPFALNSVTLICSQEARRQAAQLSECLNAESANVHAECATQCGSNYEKIHEQLRAATATAKPDVAGSSEARSLIAMSGAACTSLKCTSRCAIDALNARCAPLTGAEGTRRVGDALRGLVETVLAAHRADLDAHGLVETMMASSAPECTYHYAPLALFSAQHDAETLGAARRLAASAQVAAPSTSRAEAESQQTLAALKSDATRRLNLTLGQLQMRLIEKQMDVLDKQSRNLDRDFDKTNFELARLLQKPRGPLYASAPALF